MWHRVLLVGCRRRIRIGIVGRRIRDMLCSSRGRMLDPAVPLYLCLCCNYVVCVKYSLLGCASNLLAVKILYCF